MISLYLSQPTWLHRLPAGSKLLALALASILILSVRDWLILAFAMACAFLLAASLGVAGLKRILGLKVLLPFVLVIGVVQAFLVSIDSALVSVLRIMLMVVLADLVTITTPMQDMMRALQPLLRPLRVVGISPKQLSLAVALMIRFIPLLASQWQMQRDAWTARSPRKPGLRLLVPFIAQALRRTEHVAESVTARSLPQGVAAVLRSNASSSSVDFRPGSSDYR